MLKNVEPSTGLGSQQKGPWRGTFATRSFCVVSLCSYFFSKKKKKNNKKKKGRVHKRRVATRLTGVFRNYHCPIQKWGMFALIHSVAYFIQHA